MTDFTPGVDFPFTVWEIVSMKRNLPDGDTFPNGLVKSIEYDVVRYEQGKTSNVVGTVYLNTSNIDRSIYIPYANITKEEAVDWVKNSLGPEKVAEIETLLENRMQRILKPSTANGVPW